MDFQTSLRVLARVKALGFREEEMEIPLPAGAGGAASVPPDENYGELLETGAESFLQALALSDFPYTPKGCFAFSGMLGAVEKPEGKKGGGIRRFRFARKGAGWEGLAEAAGNDRKAAGLLNRLPARAFSDRELATQFAVLGDGKKAHVHMRVGGGWKRILTQPFAEGVWPVKGGVFAAAYAWGRDVYGNRGFEPALGNLVFAATPDGEYGWAPEEVDEAGMAGNAERFAEIFGGAHGLGEAECSRLGKFFLLSLALGDSAFAEGGGKRIYAPEFFANVPYILARAEGEKGKGNMQEALFRLRTAAYLAELPLQLAPMGGEMLALSRFFDSMENAAPKRMVLDKSVLGMLAAAGAELGKGKAAGLREGRDYESRKGKITADFGLVLALSRGLQPPAKKAGWAAPGFWNEIGGVGALLFCASYGERNSLSVLGEETQVARGSDVFKVENAGSRILVKRAMVCESGKAKEIKAHLSRIIGIADRRSDDERDSVGEMGLWGEAAYEIVQGDGRTALALSRSKRFY